MAVIINKKNPEIMANRRAAGINFITVTKKGFYFPKQVAYLIGADENKYVHFINDKDYWAFYINNDPDGFQLKFDHGYIINDRVLSRIFMHSTNKKPKDRFYVIKSAAKQNDCTIYEIHTQETIRVIMDREKKIKALRKQVLNASHQNYPVSNPATPT